MANDRMKSNENVYFRARKEAAKYNDNLNSRGAASELLGVSESSLSDYELGLTKVVPVDKVVLMADLYKAPWLKTMYCKTECPIGRALPLPTSETRIEQVTLALLHALDEGMIDEVKKDIIGISLDGVVDEDEVVELKDIMKHLDVLSEAINALRNICEAIEKKE